MNHEHGHVSRVVIGNHRLCFQMPLPLPLLQKREKEKRHQGAVIGIGETGSGEEMIVGGVAMMIIKVAGIIEEMIVIVAVGRIKKR